MQRITTHTMEHTVHAVTLAVSTLFVFAAAAGDCTGELGSTTFTPVVIKDGGDQCPPLESAEIMVEVHQNVSTFLQDVVKSYCRSLGNSTDNPGVSCAQIADQSPDFVSGNYYILNSTGSAVQVYCEMGDVFPVSLNVTDGWVRVANLNMTDPDQQCPGNLKLYTNPVRACGKSTNGDGCDSVTFSTYGIQYERVCGRVRGYQYSSTDAFDSGRGSCGYPCNDINKPYVDGVSITHGTPRQHIWTYAAGITEVPQSHAFDTCPCTGSGAAPPDYVGSDYYCESGLFQEFWSSVVYSDDPLWDGQDCDGDEGMCCDPPSLPWFCKDLSQPTTDILEVRICGDQSLGDEDVPIDIVELYIQ